MESIATLLTKALPNPKYLRTKDGSDALVLCLHCLMVEAGFESTGKKTQQKSGDSRYSPPQDWRQLDNEWFISYTRPGGRNAFTLHCSLQVTTARLFIHASEYVNGVPRRENIQVLGLQLSNYTDGQRCESAVWQGKLPSNPDSYRACYENVMIFFYFLNRDDCVGVIQNERTLTSMFREFVLSPLWENAEKDELETGDPQTSAGGVGDMGMKGTLRYYEWSRRTVLTTTLGAAALATLAAFIVIRYRANKVD